MSSGVIPSLFVVAACLAVISCGSQDQEPSVNATQWEASVCKPPPYDQRIGVGPSVWESAGCTGEYVGGALSNGFPCEQWHEQSDVEGTVYCADNSSPVDRIYYYDNEPPHACVMWSLTIDPWFRLRDCGPKPLPASS